MSTPSPPWVDAPTTKASPWATPGADVMPFGKHRGTPIKDVPKDYLRWILDNVQVLEPTLKAKIEARLNIQPATLPLAVEEPEPDPASPQAKSALTAANLEIERLRLEIKRLTGMTNGFHSDLQNARRDWLDDKLRLKNKDVEIARLKTALDAQPRRFGGNGASEFRRIVKQWYGAISRKYHPDMGGSAANQTVVNVCYRDLIERLEQMEKSK